MNDDDDDTQDYVRPCPQCEYHKNRAARWRAEAYKQGGHDVIELPWVGLTDEEIIDVIHPLVMADMPDEATDYEIARAIEAKSRSKNT